MIKVGVVFGGKSFEHEVSVVSARYIVETLNKIDGVQAVAIGVDTEGIWNFLSVESFLETFKSQSMFALSEYPELFLEKVNFSMLKSKVDIVFPIIHGPLGEDGAIQGLLKCLEIPFVGADVLASAIGMDKEVQKRLLTQSKIPIANFKTIYEGELISYERVSKELGKNLFIKPSNSGSSLGINKARNTTEFEKYLLEAFKYDRKVVVEEEIIGMEIECSVMGNDFPKASLPGRILPNHEFYTYEAKYLDENGADFEIPAIIPEKLVKKIQSLAIKTYKSLGCSGMARVDFRVPDDENIVVNEINTHPGFTPISLYPKLWQVSGLSYEDMLLELIELGFEKYKSSSSKISSYKVVADLQQLST